MFLFPNHCFVYSLAVCMMDAVEKEFLTDAQREASVNAEIDKGAMEHVMAEVWKPKSERFSLSAVFPQDFERMSNRETAFDKTLGAKEDGAGIQAMLLMVTQCGYNISDVKGKETSELIPFWNELKADPQWNAGANAFGALLVGTQNDRVSTTIRGVQPSSRMELTLYFYFSLFAVLRKPEN
jgi:hypothetical protein